ncbi:hypothetical protein ACIBKY_37700 [Nonomuraea sp. NPDC050394]
MVQVLGGDLFDALNTLIAYVLGTAIGEAGRPGGASAICSTAGCGGPAFR